MSDAIMPPQAGGRPLDLMIAVMAFLAALALGASLIAERLAHSWQGGLSGKLTVLILPPETEAGTAMADQTEAALKVLRQTPGIARAYPLSEAAQHDLVRPWLGQDRLISDLPLPQLIDADLVPGGQVDTHSLRTRLKLAAPDAMLDDHADWRDRLARLTDGVIWVAGGILILIAIAMTAAVSFATRARLEAHSDMVELLHRMGAQGGFIARIFEWHYGRAAALSALFGAIAAAGLFVMAGTLDMANIAPAPFLPPMALDIRELAVFAAIPLAAGLIGFLTARLSVFAALAKIY